MVIVGSVGFSVSAYCYVIAIFGRDSKLIVCDLIKLRGISIYPVQCYGRGGIVVDSYYVAAYYGAPLG